MDDIELACLFAGYGYQVRIVEYGADHSSPERDEAVNYDMAASMEWCLSEIRKIQQAARSGKPMTKPRWPMIVMRTPKGWTGPRALHGNVIEGNWRAHQGRFIDFTDEGIPTKAESILGRDICTGSESLHESGRCALLTP